MSGDWVTLAVLIRARGVRGEIAADGLGSRPERYEKLERVVLRNEKDGLAPLDVEIERVWEHNGRLVFKFRGVDDRDRAEELEGREVCIPMAERPPADEDEYYLSDFIGCEVVHRDGREIGEVTDWNDYGAGPLLQVRSATGSEILIPFIRAFWIEIDLERRKLVVDPPEGLLELNG